MTQYTKYPNQLDSDSELPVATDLVTPVKAEVVNRLRSAVLAIESELGTLPSGIFGNVKDRLDNINSNISTTQQNIELILEELGTDPSGSFTTVVERLDSITSSLAQLIIDIDVLETDVAAIVSTSSQPIIVPFCYNQTAGTDGYTVIGGREFNPQTYLSTGRSIYFISRIYTSNVSVAAELRLYNVTDGVVVSGTEHSNSSIEVNSQQILLEVPTDLPNEEKRYEVHLRMNTDVANITVCCETAEFLITWS